MNQILINSLVRFYIVEIITQQGPVDEGLVLKSGNILSHKIALMPFLIKTALSVMTCFFDWSGILFSGRPFHSQTFVQQRKMVANYQKPFLSLFGELFRFYKKMSIFIYFSICPAQI